MRSTSSLYIYKLNLFSLGNLQMCKTVFSSTEHRGRSDRRQYMEKKKKLVSFQCFNKWLGNIIFHLTRRSFDLTREIKKVAAKIESKDRDRSVLNCNFKDILKYKKFCNDCKKTFFYLNKVEFSVLFFPCKFGYSISMLQLNVCLCALF